MLGKLSDYEGFENGTEKGKTNQISETLRHEILYAFLCESGLNGNSFQSGAWARNEEMVDWFAIQSPKIFAIYEQLNCN